MAPKPPIYLDHHATTPVDPRVLEAMLPFFREDFGNAASKTHVYGWRAEAAVEDARERIASALGVEPSEIVFTSGATESNNLAVLGALRSLRRPGRVITTAIEHRAVLDPVGLLSGEGHETVVLPVAPNGILEVATLKAALAEGADLVSVGLANNEIGVVQPLDAVAACCRERGVLLHSDAAQAVGRLGVDLRALPVDLLSISAHKLYGPKGVGALVVRKRRPRIRLAPLMVGGGHEHGLRSGTLPVALIVGFARALELCLEEREGEAKRLRELRERMWQAIVAARPDARRNGDAEARLPGNLNVSFPGVDAERLLLDLPGLALSTGSACSSADPEPSHVLRALGLSDALCRASVRIGLGRGTTSEEVDAASRQLLRALAAQVPSGTANS